MKYCIVHIVVWSSRLSIRIVGSCMKHSLRSKVTHSVPLCQRIHAPRKMCDSDETYWGYGTWYGWRVRLRKGC
eukprot:scaffold90145_cov35-Tisochrysis_lutea.AAC.1